MIPFTGAVLTGGASRRMGRDKALLDVGGEALVLRSVRALAAAAEVFAVGGDGAALVALGIDARPDRHPGEGPLGAILTALAEARQDVVAVLSCDLLAPSPEAVAAVVGGLAASDADAAVPVVDGRRQPLVAAYRRRAAADLGDVFAAGERSVQRALERLSVVEVAGIPAAAVRDADRPEDLNGD